MPQLDVSTFTPQLFWLVVWFVVLYLLMAKLGLPRIALAIDARRQRREDDLARAVEAAQRQRALAAVLAEQIATAEQRIAATRDEALTEVRGIAIDVGRAVVEKLTGSAPNAATLAAAVDSSLLGQVPGPR